jgi:hypothetical protein
LQPEAATRAAKMRSGILFMLHLHWFYWQISD